MTEVTTRGPGRLPGSTIKRLSAVIRARYGLHNDLPLDVLLATMEYWAAQCAKLVDREAEAATTVVLTDKALAAMNVVPPALNRTRGSELVEASTQATTQAGKSRLNETLGAIFEGITKGVIGSF